MHSDVALGVEEMKPLTMRKAKVEIIYKDLWYNLDIIVFRWISNTVREFWRIVSKTKKKM